MPANIRLGWKWPPMKSALTYLPYNTLVMAAKCLLGLFCNPGVVFTRLHLIRNLLMAQYARMFVPRLERIAKDKHSSLLVPVVGNEENEVLQVGNTTPKIYVKFDIIGLASSAQW
jgi:hypothetical protein